MNTWKPTEYARRVEDMPIPESGLMYHLPNWNKTTTYRATAWAYLHREDGGEFVTIGGVKWTASRPTVCV